MRLHSVGNALQFLLIFGVNVRPKHLPRGGAEEFPIALRLVRVEQLDRLKRVGNFGREQISVLKANVRGRALQVHISPATLLETVGLLQPGVGGDGGWVGGGEPGAG